MSADTQQHRVRLPGAAGDPLPTAEVLAQARGGAWRICAEKAAAGAWPPGAREADMLGRVPLVALDVLAALCPQASRARLARCLRLDPLTAPVALEAAKDAADWPFTAVALLVLEIGGQP
jgi:hypothetical protein